MDDPQSDCVIVEQPDMQILFPFFQDLFKLASFMYNFSYADGVGLNCGCPQRWVMAEGYGSKLIFKPELVQDMVRTTKRNISKPDFSVSIKIRIHDDLDETIGWFTFGAFYS